MWRAVQGEGEGEGDREEVTGARGREGHREGVTNRIEKGDDREPEGDGGE